MSARTTLPLFLLMLGWTLSARVHGQTVEASLVSIQYVEITWTRELQWYGVNIFQVGISSEGNSNCRRFVACSTSTCSFDTSVCGLNQPCTPTSITVSGGNYTAPALAIVTAPENVTNMVLRLEEGVQYISWVNPSKESSPCYKHTAVRISFNNKNSTDYFGHGNESTSKGLCVEGNGEVEVWTEGGDGHSGSSWGTIVYTGSDVVDLVRFRTCEATGCTSLSVTWFYNPVCPDVAYLRIYLQDVSSPKYFLFNAPTNANGTTVTGLWYDRQYYTCIRAMNKDQEELDEDCHISCRTPYVVPQNLTVQPYSESTLRAIWKPPVCRPETWLGYTLRGVNKSYHTYNTIYSVRGLDSFHLYELRLAVTGHGHHNSEMTTLTKKEYTKLNAPDVNTPSVYESSVEVSWNHCVENWDDNIYYNVTWGNNLQFHGQTTEKSFLIKGFNNTNQVIQVCVAAALVGREDLTSQTDCRFVNGYSDSGMEGWETALIVVGVCLLAMVICAGIVCTSKKSKVQRGQQTSEHSNNKTSRSEHSNNKTSRHNTVNPRNNEPVYKEFQI